MGCGASSQIRPENLPEADREAILLLRGSGFNLKPSAGTAEVNQARRARLNRGMLAAPIHAAAESGSVAAVAWLLARGADLEARDSYHQSALMLACSRGHLGVAELLFANGVRGGGHATTSTGATLLHMAAGHGATCGWVLRTMGNEAVASALVQGDHHGDTPLLRAVLAGDLPACRLLVAAALPPAPARNRGRATPAPLAGGSSGDDAVGAALASVRAQHVKQHVNLDGSTLLHCACLGGHARVLRWLLGAAGCELLLAAADRAGDTALAVAVHWAQVECCGVLAQWGALAAGGHVDAAIVAAYLPAPADDGQTDEPITGRPLTAPPGLRARIEAWAAAQLAAREGFLASFLVGTLKKRSKWVGLLRRGAKLRTDEPRRNIAEYAGVPFGRPLRYTRELRAALARPGSRA
jgi:hypothetical protein